MLLDLAMEWGPRERRVAEKTCRTVKAGTGQIDSVVGQSGLVSTSRGPKKSRLFCVVGSCEPRVVLEIF